MANSHSRKGNSMINSTYKSLDDLSSILDPAEPVFFDTETDGFYGEIVLAQLYQSHLDYVILVKRPDPFRLAIELNNYTIIMHNASYDISTIQQQSSTAWVPQLFEDTFYLARLFYYKKASFNLDKVMGYVLGYDPYEAASLDKSALQKSDWSSELTEDQLQYACMDVWHLRDVYNQVKRMESDYNYKLDIHTLRHCLSFQNNGMPVLQGAIDSRLADNKSVLAKINLPINANSYQQVRTYIEEDRSNGLALALFSVKGNQRAVDVRVTRKLVKQNNYLTRYSTETVYGKFLPSARSGRLTCKDDNLQQIPRAIRHCFGYEEEDDRVLVTADYPAIELRCISAIAGEKKMATMFNKGMDVHGMTAANIFSADWTKEQRRITKYFNFNLLYGGGAQMAQNIILKDAGVLIPLSVVQTKKRQWHKFWPGITSWQKRTIQSWKDGEEASTPMGRKYVGARCTDHLNIMVQGFAAEVAKLALHRLMDAIAKLDTRIKLLNFIHDNFVLSCPKEEELYKELSIVLANVMEQAWFECQVNIKIRGMIMPIEVFVGQNWGAMEDDYLHKYTSKGVKPEAN